MATPTYSPEEIKTMLTAWGIWDGTTMSRAAMHLLTFTELPYAADFPPHLHIRPVRDLNGDTVMVASVRDWPALLDSACARRAGTSDERMLLLAHSMLKGAPVSLWDTLGGFGFKTSKRVVEAVLVGTGYAEFYEIAATGKLAEQEAWHEKMFGKVAL